MEAVSGGEIRTDEPAALDVSVRLLLAGERESLVEIAHTCLILKHGFTERTAPMGATSIQSKDFSGQIEQRQVTITKFYREGPFRVQVRKPRDNRTPRRQGN